MNLTKTTFFLGCVVGGMGSALIPIALQGLQTTAKAETRLLPFQGRLTDAAGAVITDGAKVVEFKMYDAPSGGSAKWAGEVHKLSVNGGLVNTMLGSKAGLGSVDFATPTFLQITVDADGDGQITAADPPLLPRQTIQPAVYALEAGNARDSVKLAGADWSAMFVNQSGAATNDPVAGLLNGAKISPASVSSLQLKDKSVNSGHIQDSAIDSNSIIDGAIQSRDLSENVRQSVVPVGGVLPFAGKDVSAPPGWQICDGRSVSRTDPIYSALFAVIGTNHGSSDSTQFNLPDYRGRFLRGISNEPSGEEKDLDRASRLPMHPGGEGGVKVGSVQADRIAGHTHSAGSLFAAINHKNSVFHLNEIGTSNWERNGQVPTSAGSSVGGNQNEGVRVLGSTASEENISGETRPKNAYVNYIIKL